MGTREPCIASRRSPRKKALPRVCSRVSLRTSCAALAVHWCLSCTTVPRCTSASEVVVSHGHEQIFVHEALYVLAVTDCGEVLQRTVGRFKDRCRSPFVV